MAICTVCNGTKNVLVPFETSGGKNVFIEAECSDCNGMGEVGNPGVCPKCNGRKHVVERAELTGGRCIGIVVRCPDCTEEVVVQSSEPVVFFITLHPGVDIQKFKDEFEEFAAGKIRLNGAMQRGRGRPILTGETDHATFEAVFGAPPRAPSQFADKIAHVELSESRYPSS